MIDIDRNLITYPELWAVFDKHPLSKHEQIRADPLQAARREAYIWAVFNLYEMIFTFYTEKLGRRLGKHDADEWRSWASDIRQFLEESREAREYFKQPGPQEVFTRGFVEFMNGLIAACEQRTRAEAAR